MLTDSLGTPAGKILLKRFLICVCFVNQCRSASSIRAHHCRQLPSGIPLLLRWGECAQKEEFSEEFSTWHTREQRPGYRNGLIKEMLFSSDAALSSHNHNQPS